jgi:diguanylate cyclase (GGDEF)-like protein
MLDIQPTELHQRLNAAARSDRTDQKPYLLIGLCGINYHLQNHGKALEYCRQAADIAEQTGNKMARAAAAINLSLAYDASGDEKNQLAELQMSLTLSRELGLKRAEGMARINLAEYAMTRGDFQAGREHVSEGLRIGRELSDPIMIAVSLTNLGFASAELGNVAGGLRLYEDGIATAEQAGEMSYVVAFLPGLADLHEMAGDPTEAVKALRRRVAEGDKLYQKVHAEALAELQGKYDADNRQREIRMLKLDNQLKTAELERRNLQVRVYWLLAAVLVLVTALLLVAYRRVRTANRKLAVENIDLEQHSLCDPLTGLFNRRALQAFLDPGEPGHPRRQPLSPMAFVMIDADRFKAINDRHGHTYGDAVLIELASRLSRLVRPDDRLFRLGGEEFMLLLPAISGPDLARLCQRILLAVNHAPVAVEEARIPLTVSLGACHFPLAQDGAPGLDWQRHLHLADLALYHAKRTGRNRACLIDRIADGSEALLKQIEADFGAAMTNGSIAATVVVGEADAEPLAAPGERATPA